MTNNIHRFDFWHSWMINTETQKTVEILWYPTTHAVCATMSVLEKVLFDLVWYYVPNFWNGWNCWEEKINHCGHSLNMRREFENFQPWRDWNPFEINELWLRRTYLRFPFHKYFPKNFLPSHPLPSTNKFLVSIPRIFSANSLLFTGSTSTLLS